MSSVKCSIENTYLVPSAILPLVLPSSRQVADSNAMLSLHHSETLFWQMDKCVKIYKIKLSCGAGYTLHTLFILKQYKSLESEKKCPSAVYSHLPSLFRSNNQTHLSIFGQQSGEIDEGLLLCTFFCSFYVIYICFKITSGRKLKLLRWHYLLNNYLVRGSLICLSLLFSAQSEIQV